MVETVPRRVNNIHFFIKCVMYCVHCVRVFTDVIVFKVGLYIYISELPETTSIKYGYGDDLATASTGMLYKTVVLSANAWVYWQTTFGADAYI